MLSEKLLLAGSVIFAAGINAAPASAADPDLKIDVLTGLKIAPGWELVKTNCTVCHSTKMIVLQQGSRETWLEMIRWMQKTQGLWAFDSQTEAAILDYLATNYPPSEVARRANLPEHAMPENPWQ